MSRRLWFALDALFMADPKVQALGREFGPDGPLAIVHMMGVAKVQDEPDGRFTLSWGGLADGAFLRSPKRAKDIVALASTLDGVVSEDGSLPLLELMGENKRDFTARFPAWNFWQRAQERKDPNGARRQALFRNTELRTMIRERDGGCCRYCGVEVRWNDRRGPLGGTYDHIDPTGGNEPDNLAVACRGCNARKLNRTPQQAGMPLLPLPAQVVDLVPRSKSELDTDLEKNLPTVQDSTKQNPPTPSGEGAKWGSDVRWLFDYWRKACNHEQAKLTPERRKAVADRLKQGYSVADIRTAIDGAARAPYVNETGKKFDDLGLICRNGTKLEDFMGRANGNQSAALPDAGAIDAAYERAQR